ncbi:isoamylase 3, chloroplastic [Trifolium repens]|nr:isoamylase 3, chloroplastic [Trifolium repens]
MLLCLHQMQSKRDESDRYCRSHINLLEMGLLWWRLNWPGMEIEIAELVYGLMTSKKEKIQKKIKNKLGVNCIELMPCHEFNELEYYSYNVVQGDYRVNFWGYSTINYFSPIIRYSSADIQNCGCDGINEIKFLIKEAHKRGIEVIMDVVFNHTAEGNEKGPIISFRGVDNSVYYMVAPKKQHVKLFNICHSKMEEVVQRNASGIFTTAIARFTDLDVLLNLVSIGTLFVFYMVTNVVVYRRYVVAGTTNPWPITISNAFDLDSVGSSDDTNEMNFGSIS